MHRTNDLAATLRAAIARGDYGAGQLIPSERELAARHTLSRTTVRRAIEALIDEGLLRRVPGSGTYVASPRAAAAEHATLGLIVPSLANPYFGELATAIEREGQRAGYQLLLGQSTLAGHSEAPYLARYAENPAVKGVIAIASGAEIAAEPYARLARAGKPFLFVVRQAETIAADSVATDHVGGARELMQHLIGLGHRRIAYIGVTHQARHYHGYLEALRAAGLPADPALQVSIAVDDLERGGEQGARALLTRGVAFTAVFAQIDIVAVGVLRALRAAGLRVPADISLVGFDNIPSAAHLDPPLTTVDHTVGEIGRLAVLLLQDRITGRYDGPARRVIIQPRLVLRGSAGPAPAAPTP
ncbi:GntR family transcriptional regulator [Kouleothrix sp.]|uniref:GntR family transcriptional regulator n=1 Tax=Kouleothrix sp. TaxID=2779161 RepID=UPI00391C7B9E